MAPFKHASGGDTMEAGLWEVTGKIVGETDKAIKFTDGGAPQWLPRSRIKIEDGRDGLVNVFMPEWLAKEKGYV